ncbi:MAG: hypothetical protein KAV87_00750 [Desulfobacteraceae bacterium]|nr:hypothetical protein [Desulfobacteraceae bacterium]
MIKLKSGIRASRNHAEVPQKANQLSLQEIIAVCSRCLSMKYEQCVKLLTVLKVVKQDSKRHKYERRRQGLVGTLHEGV